MTRDGIWSHRGWWVLGVLAHLALQAGPSAYDVWASGNGRDYASYYYAAQVAADGGDPYDTAALSQRAAAERTRRGVNPYFYPPPFLLTQAWALPLSLSNAYRGMWVLNELLLAGALFTLARLYALPAAACALLLCTFTPLPDHATMGQANLLALLPALVGLGLARTRPVLGGIGVGIAGMLKMSPALFLLYWVVRREWKPVLVAAATAVGLSLVSLPLVGWDVQWRFYTEVLPGFGRGDYHDLAVPIGLNANHSLPDLLNRLWPGPSKTALSETAAWAMRGITLLSFGGWAWVFRRRAPTLAGESAAIGALTLLLVFLPTYTYEHHLVFLLLPVALCVGRLPWWAWVPAYVFLALPLEPWRWLQKVAGPSGGPWVRESKFMAELAYVGLMVWLYRREGATPDASSTVRSSVGTQPLASSSAEP